MKHKRVEMVMRRWRAFRSLNFIYGLSLPHSRALTNNKYKHNLLSLDLSSISSPSICSLCTNISIAQMYKEGESCGIKHAA